MTRNHSKAVVHLELHTGNLPRACEFYAGLYGWRPERIEAAGGTYWSLDLGGSVLLEPREGPAGWRSVVTAPAGGEIALWQPKSVAAQSADPVNALRDQDAQRSRA